MTPPPIQAATAIKIAFALQAPGTSDGCFCINIHSLYQQCLEADIAFHEWYDWIKLQLGTKQASLPASVTSSPNSPINIIGRDLPGPSPLASPLPVPVPISTASPRGSPAPIRGSPAVTQRGRPGSPAPARTPPVSPAARGSPKKTWGTCR